MDQVDDYHGVTIADPWRWLENPDTPQSQAWIAARQHESRAFLDAIPQREAIETRLAALWNYPRWSAPSRRGGNLFFSKNSGLQNQAVVRVSSGAASDARVLLDPNTLSSDGTVALVDLKASRDGALVAYALSSAGSDWVEWRVREVATGRDRDDVLRWSKFSSAAWLPDGSGFFYSRYPTPESGQSLRGVNRNQHLCLHLLSTPQSADVVICERSDQPDWGFSGEVTEDGKYLVIPSWVGTDSRNRVFLKRMAALDAPVTPLFTAFDASFDFLGSEGDTFYFRTDHSAPRSKVVAVNVLHPEPENWRTVVPEGAGTLADARMAGGKVLLLVMENVRHRLYLHETSGALVREIALPGSGTVGALCSAASTAPPRPTPLSGLCVRSGGGSSVCASGAAMASCWPATSTAIGTWVLSMRQEYSRTMGCTLGRPPEKPVSPWAIAVAAGKISCAKSLSARSSWWATASLRMTSRVSPQRACGP